MLCAAWYFGRGYAWMYACVYVYWQFHHRAAIHMLRKNTHKKYISYFFAPIISSFENELDPITLHIRIVKLFLTTDVELISRQSITKPGHNEAWACWNLIDDFSNVYFCSNLIRQQCNLIRQQCLFLKFRSTITQHLFYVHKYELDEAEATSRHLNKSPSLLIDACIEHHVELIQIIW